MPRQKKIAVGKNLTGHGYGILRPPPTPNNNNSFIYLSLNIIRITDNLKYPKIVKNARLPVNYIYTIISGR